MNQNQLELAAEERLCDAMLDEIVQAKGAAPVVQRRRSRGLAAALMLLGIAVVVCVVVTRRSEPAVAVATEQEPEQLPPVVKVRGMAELLKANRKVENLSCAIEGPDFAPLSEFTALRALRVEQDHDLPFRTLDQAAWSLRPIVGCTKLELLSVGPLARFTAAELAPVGALPNLRSLELAGAEKVVDAACVAVLAKLPLRSLVLLAVDVRPDGMRALGELPLLERLELGGCTGLEQCDLKHLYRLRQLRALTLRGVGDTKAHVDARRTEEGTGVLIELPMIGADGEPMQPITVHWMRGLAASLPNLRELDLSESRIDDEVLTALPRRLASLRLVSTQGFGAAGVAAVAALSELKTLACSDPQPPQGTTSWVPIVTWRQLLLHTKLKRFEYTGFAGLLAAELSGQTELEELRFDQRVQFSFQIRGEGRGPDPAVESPMPSFASLAGLSKLTRIELLAPSPGLEAAIRKAVPARVRIEILPR